MLLQVVVLRLVPLLFAAKHRSLLHRLRAQRALRAAVPLRPFRAAGVDAAIELLQPPVHQPAIYVSYWTAVVQDC